MLVEDNPEHSELILKHLERSARDSFSVRHFSELAPAMEHLRHNRADVLLLDLSLPDSEIKDTLPAVVGEFPDLPVVVLTSLNDLDYATELVQQGAQDFLVKTDLSGALLMRSITYAVERKRYATALERSNADLRQFASTVAHEIRSPMAVIDSCFEILLRRYGDVFDDKTLNVVERTRDRVKDVATLVHDMLRFARVSPESHFRTFDASQACDDALRMLEMEIRESRATVERGELPMIVGDSGLIRQVFQNLISNAIKYCSEQPVIRITCREEGPVWLFTVTDNGVGIPERDRAAIFEIFKKVENHKRISGTGIGLSLSRRILEHHNGELWFESELGKGSTFYFTVPKDPQSQPAPCRS